ncbi:hypothetical protein HN51_005027 [Arachis hypogaea]
MLFKSSGTDILNQGQDTKYVKFLILALSLVLEFHKAKERAVEYGNKARTDVANVFSGIVDGFNLIVDGFFFTTSRGLSSFEHPLNEVKPVPRVDSSVHSMDQPLLKLE